MAWEELLIIAGGTLLVVVIGVLAALPFRERAAPGEIVVLTGSPRGLRIVPPGGMRVRTPLIEKAERMRAELPPVSSHLTGIYSNDGAVLIADVDAAVRLALSEPGVHRAIERFLGRPADDATRVARDTIEGHVRGVLAKLTSAEARSDLERLSEEVVGKAERDLRALGIEVDTLRLRVRDTRGRPA